jgi:deazaflavin-dependent oxidoreductase (nitroreductase family)
MITMLLQQKPTGFMRLWFRFPIYLYRLGLGWLGGHQFLLLTHRGRRTGLLRQTVLKVLHYDPTTGEAIVMAPLGERADWVRNIQHSPPLEVQIGRRCYVPTYRILPNSETITFLGALQRAHPVWAAIGTRALGLKSGQWSGITLVSFQLAKETAHPPRQPRASQKTWPAIPSKHGYAGRRQTGERS